METAQGLTPKNTIRSINITNTAGLDFGLFEGGARVGLWEHSVTEDEIDEKKKI